MSTYEDDTPNTLNSQGNSGDPLQGTPLQRDEPVGPFDEIETVTFPDGSTYVKSRITLHVNPITGKSQRVRENLPVPEHLCANPFGLHGDKHAFPGYKGTEVTDKGTVLCKDCLEINKKRAKWQFWIGTLCYRKEVY